MLYFLIYNIIKTIYCVPIIVSLLLLRLLSLSPSSITIGIRKYESLSNNLQIINSIKYNLQEIIEKNSNTYSV